MPGFVHLHTHSEFSLLDGAARLDALVRRAADLQMPALALTDHGVMYGALDFYTKCRGAGIKPILGVEAYVAPGSHKEKRRGDEKTSFHLLLLARNLQGYKNLLKLTTAAAIDGFYYKPRIDHALLEKWHEGLIATSTCLGGEVCQALLKDDYPRALRIAGWHRDLFGPENYYIELQDHRIPEQARCNEGLLKIARDLGLATVCTNDIHYLTQGDAYAHGILLCIGTGATIHDQKKLEFKTDEFYMKSAEEMARLFPPETLERTLEIAEKCSLELEFGRAPLPAPDLPDGRTPNTYLRELAEEGLARRLGTVPDRYRERLDYELGIIEQTGFAQYFLIVRDFARFARERGIFFGVRGSAAGSLTSFCVDITDIDPVDYDLTFERFLNPERIQMPDIDMDFEDARREEVIQYVTEKYGRDHVAQIITFGTLAARAAIKDTGRALGIPIPEVNRVVAMIPAMPLGITLSQALEASPELMALYRRDPEIARLIDTAKRLEGLSRHASVHAAGVVISHEPLEEYTPLQRAQDGGCVTQYPAGALEKIGLLKMDFLGLINLSILGRTVENIRQTRGLDLDIQRIPLDDQNAFELLGRGDTTGIFQLESAGMRRYIAELKPTSVRDLAAMVALYRPGPMAHIPTFIRAKHGLEKITYPHDLLKPILEETYGVIVYQDQVMRIAQAIAGYTLGQADILRRAMGKKKREVMVRERKNFIAGAASNGISAKKAGEIFDLIEPFAGYAFNKAHAVCYAMVAYQTAYLKANYPVEYMAALLACYNGKTDKIASCMEDCARMRIRVLPPDVNRSDVDFTAEAAGGGAPASSIGRPHAHAAESGMAIRFGLAGIKNVGRAAVDAILAARRCGGPFRSLADFCRRTGEQGTVSRAAIEALIRSGAFTSIHPNRRALVEALDAACQQASKAQRDREIGQESLFGGQPPEEARTEEDAPLPDVPDYSTEEMLAFEKELLGIYVTDHPLEKHRAAILDYASASIEALKELGDGQKVRLGGIITSVKPFTSKKSQEPMAFMTLEDLSGQNVAVTVFPSTYREYGRCIGKDRIVLLSGRTSVRQRIREDEPEENVNVEVLAEEIMPLGSGVTAAGNGHGEAPTLCVRLDQSQVGVVHLVRSALENSPGNTPVVLHVHQRGEVHVLATEYRVDPSAVRPTLERLVGRQGLRLSAAGAGFRQPWAGSHQKEGEAIK